MKPSRWIRNLYCRWFGHKIELVEHTASVWLKVNDCEWSTETATRNLRTCKRCGWTEPCMLEVAPPNGSMILLMPTLAHRTGAAR